MGFEHYFWFLYACALTLATVVGVPQPFSMPPLPEDPALLRMVPNDCVCAVTWSGAAAPAADSRNRTELLCAEPEVRRAMAALRSATEGMFARSPAAATIARAGLTVACDALQHPGCAFVHSIAHQPKKTLAAGIALHLGTDAAAAKTLLGLFGTVLRARHGGGAELHDDVEVDDVRFRALPTDVRHPFLGWAEVDGWLLVAIGEPSCTQLVHGLRGTDEGLRGVADVQRLLAATAVARPATRAYVDCARLLAALRGMGDEAAIERVATALGLLHAGAALSTTGLDADGFTARVHLDVPERTGLLGALAAAPIAQDALLTVPADADVALALHLDTAALERVLLDFARARWGDDAQADYESFQREFATHLGVAWQRDLLLHLDGQVTLWNAPSQGGLGVTAAGATLGLQDGAAFATAWQTVMTRLGDKLPDKAKATAGGGRLERRQYLESFAHGATTVHWIDNFDDDFPFAVAAAPAKAALALGLSPQTVRDTLDVLAAPNPDRSLLRWPQLNRRGNASGLLLLDLRALLTACWPLLAMTMQANTQQWQRDGFDFDAADLPRPSVLLPLLGRELILVEPTQKGIAWVRTGTVPVFDPLLIAGAVAIGVMLAD